PLSTKAEIQTEALPIAALFSWDARRRRQRTRDATSCDRACRAVADAGVADRAGTRTAGLAGHVRSCLSAGTKPCDGARGRLRRPRLRPRVFRPRRHFVR